MMVQAGDTGKDFEHCQALQRKLDDVDSVSLLLLLNLYYMYLNATSY